MKEKSKSKSMCVGCYNDDYNHGLGGAKECWSFEDAKVIDRLQIHINQMPPYDKKSTLKMLSCYNSPKWCYPSPTALDDSGFWK